MQQIKDSCRKVLEGVTQPLQNMYYINDTLLDRSTFKSRTISTLSSPGHYQQSVKELGDGEENFFFNFFY